MTKKQMLMSATFVQMMLLRRVPQLKPVRGSQDPLRHVLWMMQHVPNLVRDGKRQRANRWLGFAQGFLWAHGWVTADDLKLINNGKLPFEVNPETQQYDVPIEDDEVCSDCGERYYACTCCDVPQRYGIYIASKAKHAARWRRLRDDENEPIISSWIDLPPDSGELSNGERDVPIDYRELWQNIFDEISRCRVLIAYHEPGEVWKGTWVEIGAALSQGVPVLTNITDKRATVRKHKGVTFKPTLGALFLEASHIMSAHLSPKEKDDEEPTTER